jgi:ribonuclease P protein component
MITFKKEERLSSKILIEKLFSSGKSILIYPFKINYYFLEQNQKAPLQLLISVSKRNFKSAVKRNYIKRLIRESYRINKDTTCKLLINSQLNLIVSFSYISKEILDYRVIEEKLKEALNRLEDEIKKVIADNKK